MEKGTLTDRDHTAYQWTLMDDSSRGDGVGDRFLDPDMRTIVRALIAAMRQWRLISQAVRFDHGAPFPDRLLVACCQHVGSA